MIRRLLIIGSVLLALQLINADDTNSTSSTLVDDEADYDDEVLSTSSIAPDHWKNCTFNGTVYFDDECAEWMRSFYVVVAISLIGMIMFVLVFYYVGRKCLKNRSGDFERLIENDDVAPTGRLYK